VGSCWCDHSCLSHGDCCDDVCDVCNFCSNTTTYYQTSFTLSVSGVNASVFDNETIANISSSIASGLNVTTSMVSITVTEDDDRRDLRGSQYSRLLTSAVSLYVVISGATLAQADTIKDTMNQDGAHSMMHGFIKGAGVPIRSEDMELSQTYVVLDAKGPPGPAPGLVPPPDSTAMPTRPAILADVSVSSSNSMINQIIAGVAVVLAFLIIAGCSLCYYYKHYGKTGMIQALCCCCSWCGILACLRRRKDDKEDEIFVVLPEVPVVEANVLCAKGHPMKKWQLSREHSCNDCGYKYNDGKWIFTCLTCEHDLCEFCIEELQHSDSESSDDDFSEV